MSPGNDSEPRERAAALASGKGRLLNGYLTGGWNMTAQMGYAFLPDGSSKDGGALNGKYQHVQ
jgi:hypothetical protein